MKAIKSEFKKLKKILLPILLVLLSSLFVFAVVKITSIKTKTISSFEYSVGSIDEATGMYKEDDQALYTKEAIECRGLTVKPEFDASVSYQVFWYNVDALYFGCTEVYSSSYKLLPDEVPEFARYCRIVIYPSQLDDEGNDIEDFKVRFYQTVSYANQLSVKVDKEQTSSYVTSNLYDDSKATYGRSFYVSEDVNGWLVNALANELLTSSNMKTSEIISLTDKCKSVEINVKPIYYATANCFIAVLDANREVIQQGYIHLAGNMPEQWYQTRITLLDEAAFIRVTMFSNSDCQIYGLK